MVEDKFCIKDQIHSEIFSTNVSCLGLTPLAHVKDALKKMTLVFDSWVGLKGECPGQNVHIGEVMLDQFENSYTPSGILVLLLHEAGHNVGACDESAAGEAASCCE